MQVLNAKNESTFRYVHWTIDLRRYVALWARNSGYEPQHVESKCLFFENGWPWEQSDPLAKKHWHLLCMHIPTGLCVAGYTFDGEEKGCTAGILVFFFPLLRSASVTPYSAICVHNHAHYLYSFMYSSKKEISQHFSRHSQTKRLQHFFLLVLPSFCKSTRLPWNRAASVSIKQCHEMAFTR